MNLETKTGRTKVLSSRMGVITLLEDGRTVELNGLSLFSDEIHAFLSKAEKKEEAFSRAVETGVAVLSRASSSLDFDYVARKADEVYNNLSNTITSFIQKNLDPSEGNTLARRITDILNQQITGVKELLSRNESNTGMLDKKIGQIHEAVGHVMKDTLGTVLLGDQSGLSIIIKQMKEEMQILRDIIVAEKTKMETSAPYIGKAFEEIVLDKLSKWAKAYQGYGNTGVVVLDTRNVVGVLGKAGDALVTLIDGGTKKIALEFKNEKKTTPQIIDALNASAENRSAQHSIYIAHDESQLPLEVGVWALYGPNFSRIVCTLSTMDVALKLSAFHLMLNQREVESEHFNYGAAIGLVDRISDALRDYATLNSSLRAIQKNSLRSTEVSSKIRTEIEDSVDKLMTLLQKSGNDQHEDQVA